MRISLPLGMANDWAKTLPKADRAMNTGRARVTKTLSPQTFLKNVAATVIFEFARSDLLMAANYLALARCWHLAEKGLRVVVRTYAIFART